MIDDGLCSQRNGDMQDGAMLASGKGRIRQRNMGGGKVDVLLQQIVHSRSTAIGEIGHGRAA
jgi:hypothetical protein